MFKRRLKYLILFLINIIILALIFSYTASTPNAVFDTEYVVDILDTKRVISEQNKALNQQLTQLQSNTSQLNTQLRTAQASVESIETQLQRCQSQTQEWERVLAENQQPVEQAKCEDNSLAQRLTDAKLRSLASDLQGADEKIMSLNSSLTAAQQTIDKQQQTIVSLHEENKVIQDMIKTLQYDLSAPIYIKKMLYNFAYCQQPRFPEQVCVEQFMLRPKLSKATQTDGQALLLSPDGQQVAGTSIAAGMGSLLRFSLPTNTELPAGEYILRLQLDGHTVEHAFTLEQPNND